jgi:hypothetical protein
LTQFEPFGTMSSMSLSNTTVTRISQLIAAVQAATAGSLDDTDELAEIVDILQEAKMQKLAGMYLNARTYIYVGARRTLVESLASNPDMTASDIKVAVLDVLNSLIADPVLLDAVLAGTVTS